ncbi:MAG: zf-HC2 domain-containing protein [Chloroflexi bacterium]|nr:zf-HC2 domain-containing protein [Chloroflexota bacterium]
MTCHELVELVTAYIEGALPDGDRQRFEAHVDVCPGCDAYLHQMRQTIQLAGTLREEDVASDAKETLLAAFRDWKASESAETSD